MTTRQSADAGRTNSDHGSEQEGRSHPQESAAPTSLDDDALEEITGGGPFMDDKLAPFLVLPQRPHG